MNLTIVKRLAQDGYFPVGMFIDACREVESEVGTDRFLGAFVKIEVGDDGVDFEWKVPQEVECE